MIILNVNSTSDQVRDEYMLYPDFFVSEKKKMSKEFIKQVLDYFYDVAIRDYTVNTNTFAHNYSFVKGQLRPQDFYENNEVRDFTLELIDDVEMPEYVQQYSILNQPLNTLVGEQSARPDNTKIKAFDDDSRSEELSFRTDLLTQYTTALIQQKIAAKAAQQGVDISTEEGSMMFESMVEEELEQTLATYSTQAEKWGNHILEALKMEFNLKEQSEEAFRDLLITGRERFHIYEDLSSLGFKVECVNPRNVWKLSAPDKKYTKDSYAAGLINIMEISEIIDRFPLTKEEIDHLRDCIQNDYLVKGEGSNLFNNRTGIDSIHYNTYSPGILETRLRFESQLMADPLASDFNGIKSTGVLGQKFVVLQAYWLAKRKIGKLTYINQEGIEETTLVDEDYKNGDHPQQIDLEWGYVNQWWKGLKIGADIYYAEPLKILDYCPIIGVDFENRNTVVKSMIDLMKPYQMIFNVCMNQLWQLLQKEKGPLMEFNIRKIPVDKDGSYDDAIDDWLLKAEELGIVFNDDSPENLQAPTSNTNVTRVHDLSLAGQMQSRLAICQAIKLECHSLVGITPERLGGVATTQTATGTNAALQSSYSQTRPWFSQHEYLMNQVYQAVLDVAQYIESEKPTSTINYITNQGESAYIQIAGPELKGRDIRTYVTDREKDQRIFQELKSLAQPMLQNGTDVFTISELYITDSVRTLRETFRKAKKESDERAQQAMAMQQQQMQAQQEATAAQIQAQQQDKEQERAFKAYQNELDRISKERIALLNASGRDSSLLSDANNDGTADALEVTRMNTEIRQADKNFQLEQARLQNEVMNQQNKMKQDEEKRSFEQKKYEEELALKKEKLRLEEKKLDVALKNPVPGEKK